MTTGFDNAEKLGAHEVAAWLRRHPGFLQQFPDLALTLVVPRENGPAVLLEVGNLIQADDWAILATDEGRQTIAQGLVAAASDSIVRPDPTTSPSPTPTKK